MCLKKTKVISRQTECRKCLWLNLRDVFQHQIIQITEEGGNNVGALCSRTEPPADRTDFRVSLGLNVKMIFRRETIGLCL